MQLARKTTLVVVENCLVSLIKFAFLCSDLTDISYVDSDEADLLTSSNPAVNMPAYFLSFAGFVIFIRHSDSSETCSTLVDGESCPQTCCYEVYRSTTVYLELLQGMFNAHFL